MAAASMLGLVVEARDRFTSEAITGLDAVDRAPCGAATRAGFEGGASVNP